MIDVSPYIDKLEKLRQYMGYRIDNMGDALRIDLSAIPSLSVEELINIAMQMNVHIIDSNKPPSAPPKKLSFDEWLRVTNNKGCVYTEWEVKSKFYIEKESDLN